MPNPPDNPAGPLSALLNGVSMVSQSWTAHDNTNQRLHDGTLDSFAAWAAEVVEVPVVLYEVDGVVGGRWPGNPNVVGKWSRNPLRRDGVIQAVRYSAVEEYNFWYAATEPTYDSYPAQRVVLLYALPVSNGRPAPFPVEIPMEGATHPLQVGQPNTDFIEPTYKDALYAIEGMSYADAALQYHFEGQWVQRFALSQPYGWCTARPRQRRGSGPTPPRPSTGWVRLRSWASASRT